MAREDVHRDMKEMFGTVISQVVDHVKTSAAA